MNKNLPFLFLFILFIWELPQNLLGLLLLAVMKQRNRIAGIQHEKHRLFIETPFMGVSLGWFVFWTPAGNRYPQLVNDCRMHEYGHARQSALFGPLYLLIVGIPSLSRVAYSRWYRKKHGRKWEHYFDAFPEKQADKLGGVIVYPKA